MGQSPDRPAHYRMTDPSDSSATAADVRLSPKQVPWSQRSTRQQFTPFRGMYHDVRRRLPYYISDWTLAFRPRNFYRVAVCTIRMYFINLMPAIAYTLDLTHRTKGAYGLNETILATALAALVFPIIGVQPLTIVGFTGLINLFNYTNYDIIHRHPGVDYLQFQCWVLMCGLALGLPKLIIGGSWGAVMHWAVAIFNLCDYTRFITDMTSTTFGLYVGIIYLQKGVELLVYEFNDHGTAAGWFATCIAILFTVTIYVVEKAGNSSYGPFRFRQGILDWTFVIGCVFWSGFAHIPNNMTSVHVEMVPITKSWFPTTDRGWFIEFWNLPVKWIFVAIPFGFLLTLLFWFDHNVSSLMASARKFPVNRPSGYHWDFFVLGWTTLVAGFLGLPAPNGLVPQAPSNTDALSVKKQIDGKIRTTRVVENRLSHVLIGAISLATMTRPFLVAIGLMPRALFAGIFFQVGWGSIEGNPVVEKTLYLFKDRSMTSLDHPLYFIKKSKIFQFVAIQWVVFGIALGISQVVAAIGFPVPYILLIPVRVYLCPKWFSLLELEAMDSPVANSAAVIDSIGGDLHLVTGERKDETPHTDDKVAA